MDYPSNFSSPDSTKDKNKLQTEGCSGNETVIIPCDPGTGGTPRPNEYTLKLNTPNVDLSIEKEVSDPGVDALNLKFRRLLAGIQTEIGYALRDLKFDDLPLGGGMRMSLIHYQFLI